MGGGLCWTELLAAFLASATYQPVEGKTAESVVAATGLPPLREDACWRAFDLISQGPDPFSAADLGNLVAPDGKQTEGGDSAIAAEGLVHELFPHGSVSSSDFLRL